ncbi:MAG: DUF438 domain-containing protein [Chloroflexi bacterium]|nr:DUF438 domain-containing protein [Chloroflexota bacterium]
MSEYINNSQKRKEMLKGLIRDLHAGSDLEEIKKRFRALVSGVSAVEIARLEQELIEEGLPAEEVRELCDVHVAVFQEGLQEETSPEMTPGHPVHTFKYENFALGEVLKLLREAMAELPDADALRRARQFAGQLAEVDKVYLRKENLLFPLLEKHGVSGPSSVMWGIHDQIRAQIKALRQALDQGEAAKAQEIFGPLAEAIESMFYKEEHILYPTALRMLSDAEWAAIRDQSDEIGYALIRPGDQWQPEIQEAAEIPRGYTAPAGAQQGQIELDTGALSAEQLNLLLKHLPVDITFVDENDTVRYFSATPERIFVRTPAIIGRKVQNCHPPASVHIVNRLLDELRQGKRDVAEFWIHMGEKYVYIRYLALRDDEGRYRGCVEVTQDVAPLQRLTGERRLLDEVE